MRDSGLGWPVQVGSAAAPPAGDLPAGDPLASDPPTSGVGWPVSRETTIEPPPAAAEPGGPPAIAGTVLAELSVRADSPTAEKDDTPLARELAEDTRRRRALGNQRLRPPPRTRILTVANQKGGVGKTTTTVNVAAALAQGGLQVLVLDLDPQGNSSTALGIPHHASVPSIYGVLVDGLALGAAVQPCPDVSGLFCAPATIDLAGAEIELVSMVAREGRLLRAVTDYLSQRSEQGLPRLDYVLVDCPPSFGLLTVNALVCAQEVFIPIQCEYYALEGVSQLLNHIELITSHLNPTLFVSTILLTMYDARTRLSAEVADQVREHYPDLVLRTSIPRSVRISEAPSHAQTVVTYDPGSSGALSYLEAARELTQRDVDGHESAARHATVGNVPHRAG